MAALDARLALMLTLPFLTLFLWLWRRARKPFEWVWEAIVVLGVSSLGTGYGVPARTPAPGVSAAVLVAIGAASLMGAIGILIWETAASP